MQTAYTGCYAKVNVFLLAISVIHVELHIVVPCMAFGMDASTTVMNRLPDRLMIEAK